MDTRVSLYDRVSGLLVALVVMFGFAALVLLIVWLTKVITFDSHVAESQPFEELGGRGDHAEGLEQEFEEPGVEELPEVAEPQLADAIEAVTNVASTQLARFEAIDGNASQMGSGAGLGDARASGPGGPGTGQGTSDGDRWQIRFSTTSQRAYADQLDFFKIELAAVHKDQPEIQYAFDLGAATPKTRKSTKDAYNKSGGILFLQEIKALKNYDANLLRKAKVPTNNRYVAWYLPPGTRQLLLNVERASLGGKPLDSVERTVFGVRSTGGGFEFYVIEQKFR